VAHRLNFSTQKSHHFPAQNSRTDVPHFGRKFHKTARFIYKELKIALQVVRSIERTNKSLKASFAPMARGEVVFFLLLLFFRLLKRAQLKLCFVSFTFVTKNLWRSTVIDKSCMSKVMYQKSNLKNFNNKKKLKRMCFWDPKRPIPVVFIIAATSFASCSAMGGGAGGCGLHENVQGTGFTGESITVTNIEGTQ
jgi:hypothetical protein